MSPDYFYTQFLRGCGCSALYLHKLNSIRSGGIIGGTMITRLYNTEEDPAYCSFIWGSNLTSSAEVLAANATSVFSSDLRDDFYRVSVSASWPLSSGDSSRLISGPSGPCFSAISHLGPVSWPRSCVAFERCLLRRKTVAYFRAPREMFFTNVLQPNSRAIERGKIGELLISGHSRLSCKASVSWIHPVARFP